MHIARDMILWAMLRVVIDTNVLVAARRSRFGASSALVRAALDGRVKALVSVALFLEYESVLLRPEQLRAAGTEEAGVGNFLDLLAREVEEVRVHYIWKPQLADVADEMVLETAINGRADAIATFNVRHFNAAARFGVRVAVPAAVLEILS